MTRRLTTALFLLVFAVWAVLEFAWRGQFEGIKDILFWIGMGCVLLSSADGRGRERTAA